VSFNSPLVLEINVMCGSDQKLKTSCVILVFIALTYSFVNSAAIQVIKQTSIHQLYVILN
jgi:hypothetical protein